MIYERTNSAPHQMRKQRRYLCSAPRPLQPSLQRGTLRLRPVQFSTQSVIAVAELCQCCGQTCDRVFVGLSLQRGSNGILFSFVQRIRKDADGVNTKVKYRRATQNQSLKEHK